MITRHAHGATVGPALSPHWRQFGNIELFAVSPRVTSGTTSRRDRKVKRRSRCTEQRVRKLAQSAEYRRQFTRRTQRLGQCLIRRPDARIQKRRVYRLAQSVCGLSHSSSARSRWINVFLIVVSDCAFLGRAFRARASTNLSPSYCENRRLTTRNDDVYCDKRWLELSWKEGSSHKRASTCDQQLPASWSRKQRLSTRRCRLR